MERKEKEKSLKPRKTGKRKRENTIKQREKEILKSKGEKSDEKEKTRKKLEKD